MIPYAKQSIDEQDIAAVAEVLQSTWLTTGPKVPEFEAAFARYTGTAEAIAVNSGTAALHAALHARGIGPGDEVIVPANTFVASANAVLYTGATPIFSDIEPNTLLLDPSDVETKISNRTRGIVSVDFAGQPCDYSRLQDIADKNGLFLHDDACHALGAEFKGGKVGALAATNSFSFHPVKPMTTAEGGMITTNDPELARKMRIFRSHGIGTDARQRDMAQTWEYDMEELGYNYRLSDLQCALGISQLTRVDEWCQKRQVLAAQYHHNLKEFDWIVPLIACPDRSHAYHLFVTRLCGRAHGKQKELFQFMRQAGIGVHIMYRPVYQHSYYQTRFGAGFACCPQAEEAYQNILTLPIYAAMQEKEKEEVLSALRSFEKIGLKK